MRVEQATDILVVGAGAAGLSAALALARSGARVTVLEAANRLGGRIFTVRPDGMGPVELGAEFVHGRPKELLGTLSDAKLAVMESNAEHFEIDQGRVRSAEVLAEVLQRLEQAHRNRGDSAFDLVPALHLDPDEARWFAHFVGGFHAAPLEHVSARSILRQTSSSETDGRVKGGFGALVEYFHRELELCDVRIFTNTRVRKISVEPGGVVASAAGVEYRSMACVVALPFAVLEQKAELGGIAWAPRPAWLAPFVTRFAMGRAFRVTFTLARELELLGDLPGDAFLHCLAAPFPTWWLRPSAGPRELVAWCGGPRSEGLADEDAARAAAFASLAMLTKESPAELERAVRATHVHDFCGDPFARGAYPYELATGALNPDLPAALGAAPLVLAGDFLDPEAIGTVGAAVKSGQAAAELITARRG